MITTVISIIYNPNLNFIKKWLCFGEGNNKKKIFHQLFKFMEGGLQNLYCTNINIKVEIIRLQISNKPKTRFLDNYPKNSKYKNCLG